MIRPSLVEGSACWRVGKDISKWVNALSVGAATAVSQALERGAVHRCDQLFVPVDQVSRWPETVAQELGLPPNCPLALDLRLSGALGRDGAKLAGRWLQPGKTIPARDVEVRDGWLYRGDQVFRLQAPLAEIVGQVEAFNRLPSDDRDGQFRVWAGIRACLGDDAANQLTDGFLKSLRVVTASAFTWLIRTDKLGQIELVPNLLTEQHSEDGQTSELVAALPPADGEVFANRLDQLQEGASAFPVNQGLYVVAEEQLRKALTAVRKLRKAPAEQRKRAALHPEAVIRELLDQPEDEPSVFVETERFADRVVDVAEWIPPVLG